MSFTQNIDYHIPKRISIYRHLSAKVSNSLYILMGVTDFLRSVDVMSLQKHEKIIHK